MILISKPAFKLLLCIIFCITRVVLINAQVCSGSWALSNPLTLGCMSGQFVGSTNPAANPPGCPLNPTYTGGQSNTFLFTSSVSSFTIDFFGFDSSPGCARIEVRINGTFYHLTSANLINFAQNLGGPCTTPIPANRVTVTSDGYITSNSLGVLGGGSEGGIYINSVNATNVTVATNDANGTLFSSPYNCIVVPLKLINFNGYSELCKIQLNWKTGIESNIKNIEIQRSEEGSIFNKMGELVPKGSNSLYSFVANSMSNAYFRLKINDLDGYYEYSEVLYLKSSCNKTTYEVKPNPARSLVQVVGIKKDDQVLVLDILGRVVKDFHSPLNSNNFDIQTLAPGMYILQVINDDQVKCSLKIIKN